MKFTKKGSVKIRVEIEDREEGQFLKVSVIDTGVGIPYEDQDKLFKLFGFIQNTEHGTSKGIGLGLVISDNIVKKFNGQIAFKSVPAPELNHGSEFYFTFKLTNSGEVSFMIGISGEDKYNVNVKDMVYEDLDLGIELDDSAVFEYNLNERSIQEG